MENFLIQKIILKDKNDENNLSYVSKLLVYYQENFSKLNYFKISYAADLDSYAVELFGKIHIKITKSYELKRNEYINHLERFFYFMNI